MKVNFQRRMQGSLSAEAVISPEQIKSIESDEKGSFLIPVIIADESDQLPIECEMEWAWVSKKSRNKA
jgi:hypothetical protein